MFVMAQERRLSISERLYFDYSEYNKVAFRHVHISVWEANTSEAIYSEDFKLLKWELFLPIQLAEIITKRAIQKKIDSANEELERQGEDIELSLQRYKKLGL